MLKLNVLGVTVRRTDLADTILLDLDETVPLAGLPFLGETANAVATIELRAGHGVAWCRRVFGVEPKVIDARGTAPNWMVVG